MTSATGLQKVDVEVDGHAARVYVLTQLTGPVAAGDRVVVNTTAVDLGLGTGGWHFVHWNLERGEWVEPGPGHIMKLRYTSLQADIGSTEEHLDAEASACVTIDGLPVVATPLHSQLPAVAIGIRSVRPDARIAYVMTDGAALPLALSDLVATLRDRGLVDTTITCGHAFGGDHEAVNIFSALMIARHVAGGRCRDRGDGAGHRRHRHRARLHRSSRSAPCSMRPSGSAARRSRACGHRRPTAATATRASRTTP